MQSIKFYSKFILLGLLECYFISANPNLQKRQENINLDTWKKFEYTLSAPRSRLAGASAGNMLLFAGGIDSAGESSEIVDLYNASNGALTTARLSSPRSEIGSSSFLNNRYAIFAGGIGKNVTVSSSIDIYDSETGTWILKNLSEARANPRVLDLGNRLVIYGGNILKSPYLSRTIDILDASFNLSSQTESVLDYPQLGASASGVDRSTGMIMGGYENQNPNNRFSKLVASSQTLYIQNLDWTDRLFVVPGPVLEAPRWEASAAYANSQFIFAGGYIINANKEVASNRIDVFDYSTFRWSNQTLTLNSARFSIYSGTIKNHVLFWGGSESKMLDVYNSVERKMVNPIPESLFMNGPRYEAGQATLNNCLFAVGGGFDSNGEKITNLVEVINACN
ncbi:hypothetical protein BB561_002023 [Smittium simulii]|uniref:PLD phosphodiesterase domain-containing protein n=1 Tax=Smittium simulii TaxID=133385 RepID=A0A2T9YS19_9FUNG|nr:hypothetical protein BB561_002023 [Smittium simulii]